MVTTLIIPGLFGSRPGHWQRHWLDDFNTARLLDQDNWDRPQRNVWLGRLENMLEEIGEVYIVAHSLGCLLTAALAERPAARFVKAAMLVAPCDLDIAERLHPGFIDFEEAPSRSLPFASVVVGSLNDPYMPLDGVTEIATRWRSDLEIVGMAGHINIDSGHGRWTGGYGLFEKLVAKAQHLEKIPSRRWWR